MIRRLGPGGIVSNDHLRATRWPVHDLPAGGLRVECETEFGARHSDDYAPSASLPPASRSIWPAIVNSTRINRGQRARGRPRPRSPRATGWTFRLYAIHFNGDVYRFIFGDTAERMAARMPLVDRPLERFLILNGLNQGDALTPGEKVKIVTE